MTPLEPVTGYAALSRREWLCTNGTGSFASGTVASTPTRRYHALLVAALSPPAQERMTVLSHLHETVTINGVAYDLHTGRYADGTLHPQGWHYVSTFDAAPVPTWQYDFPSSVRIVKRVFLAPGANTVYVTYTKAGGDAVDLTVSPLTCWKDYHHEMRPWSGYPTRQGFSPSGYDIQATPDALPLRLALTGAKWTRAGWWHRNNFHEREAERGQDAVEDLYCPASATVTLTDAGQSVTFVATIEPGEPLPASGVLDDIVRGQNELLKTAHAESSDAATRTLVIAADQFVVRAGVTRTTILAGYPWFTDWGRDTFIALPGLCLSTGRLSVAREILLSFVPYVSQGMIPNRFPDAAQTPDYNTADATLWFVHACGAYKAAVPDDAMFVERLAPVLRDIIAWHERGTCYGIGVDAADGLLRAGEIGTQLTWMDAKIGDYVVTPRIGKPVEINALWVHALRVTYDFSGDETYLAKAEQSAQSFRQQFVRPDGNGLYDVIAPDGIPDPAIRPNQVFAVSLDASLLTSEQARSVVDTVTRELWTPLGLRTLSPSDPAYRSRYEGDAYSRDTAYHQGTVWPWLIGAYSDACRVVRDAAPDLSALLAHLSDYGVNGIAEVFDASEPHRANGCPWQAWSVAEVLRVLLRPEQKSGTAT